jgi:hypothetical protein
MLTIVRYMLRPVAHCKEGCSRLSWVRRKTAHRFHKLAEDTPR